MSLEGKPVEVVQQDTDSSPPRSIDEPKEYDEHLDAFGFNVDEFKALGVDILQTIEPLFNQVTKRKMDDPEGSSRRRFP